MLVRIAMQARKDVARVPQHPEKAIHSLRKRMKKTQALLHLAAPALDKKSLESVRAGIREIKDAAMSRRDADVLAGLAAELEVAPPAICISDPDLGMLDAYLAELVDTLEALPIQGLTWQGVSAGHLKTCRRARKAWKRAREHPSAENLHRWRKRVKDQYHQSLAMHRWLGQSGTLRRVRRLGSLLGKCHDLDVFAIAIEADPKVRRKIGNRRGRLARRALQRAEKVFAPPLSRSRRRVSKLLPAGAR